MWGQLSTTCSNVLKQPNGELLVAVNHKQLRTMASETVDPIDWSHAPPSWAVPPERFVHSINQCTQRDSNVQPQHVRQPPCLCGHSGYYGPLDDNNVEIATFMDLSKAFDCVDHKILFTKIKRYGVHSTPLRWIRSYLSNREHFVSWNQIHSTL